MPTLADVLRQTGYAQDGTLDTPTPTESPMTKALAEHIASIPQKFATNQAEQMALLNKAFPGNTYESMMTQGDPKAMAELAMQTPFNAMIAYHGTPHNILGKFDINKVGIGEGNQVYGHGMYFAENPEVANTYKNIQPSGGFTPYTRRTLFGEELTPQTPEYHAAHMVDKLGIKKAKAEFADWLKNPPDYADESLKSNWQQSLETLNKATKKSDFGTLPFEGNLYKVDIPDKDIPNMLNWDEKVPEDLRKRISKLTMEQFGNGATGTSGEHLYKEIVFEMRRNGSKSPEADASKWLYENGIPGIVYKDAGSRGVKGGTSNYVVFEPSEVKILEKNSKPVSRKELIEEQVNKLKD